MQKHLGKCHSTWKPTTLPQRCPSWHKGSGGRPSTSPELRSMQKHLCPWPPSSVLHAQVSKPGLAGLGGWGSPATPSPQKHDLLPAAETGTRSEIQHCPVSSYLTLRPLCDFLGLFLKLYGLNISCCNAAYQLTSQEDFLNWYKLIIPHTHRSFLQQAWTICSLTTG